MSRSTFPPEDGLAYVRLGPRTRVELVGDDRAKFLHNLSTQEIRKRQSGEGCEALLLDARGHVRFHVLVLVGEASITLDTWPGQAEKLLAHLERYIIREQVTLVDRSAGVEALYLAGPATNDVLAQLGAAPLVDALGAHQSTTMLDRPVQMARVGCTRPPGVMLFVEATDAAMMGDALAQHGAQERASADFEAARILARWPGSKHDFDDKTLAQELGRDGDVISFIKGCYLGQETVARLDALGHVNRAWQIVRGRPGVALSPGDELRHDGTVVGRVASTAQASDANDVVALAFLRVGHDQPGLALDAPAGTVEVVAR